MTVAEKLVDLLKAQGLTCATAESCTGGGIGSALCGLLLAAGGFDGLAAVQTDGALCMITFMYIVIPFLFQILQTLLISQLKVEQANRDWDNAHATEAKA